MVEILRGINCVPSWELLEPSVTPKEHPRNIQTLDPACRHSRVERVEASFRRTDGKGVNTEELAQGFDVQVLLALSYITKTNKVLLSLTSLNC